MVLKQRIAERGQAYRNFKDSDRKNMNTNAATHNPMFSSNYNFSTRVAWDDSYDKASMTALNRANNYVNRN